MLRMLAECYRLPGTTVIRQMIRQAFQEHFPGQPPRFPADYERHLTGGHRPAKRGMGSPNHYRKVVPRAPIPPLKEFVPEAAVPVPVVAIAPEEAAPKPAPDGSLDALGHIYCAPCMVAACGSIPPDVVELKEPLFTSDEIAPLRCRRCSTTAAEDALFSVSPTATRAAR